jgi:choline-sulfatase
VARRAYWDLYSDCKHLQPDVAALPYADHDPHSQRIFDANDWRSYTITEDDIARSRRAYFANISYLDTRSGASGRAGPYPAGGDRRLRLGPRRHAGRARIVVQDELLRRLLPRADDDRGPGIEPGLIDTPVSTLDLCPTLCDLAGVSMAEVMPWTDGESLLPLMRGGERDSPVAMEYAAEGTVSPMIALCAGRWKYTNCAADPEQLFDLETDPHEMRNLADDPAHADTLERFRVMAAARWDLEAFDAQVRDSQARRIAVYDALRNGAYFPWDFQPLRAASERYMRNHMDLNVLEESQRFPRGE